MNQPTDIESEAMLAGAEIELPANDPATKADKRTTHTIEDAQADATDAGADGADENGDDAGDMDDGAAPLTTDPEVQDDDSVVNPTSS